MVLSGTPASSITKTGRHDIAEILLKVALNTVNQIKPIRHKKNFHCGTLSDIFEYGDIDTVT
jgi:hypothetical protein